MSTALDEYVTKTQALLKRVQSVLANLLDMSEGDTPKHDGFRTAMKMLAHAVHDPGKPPQLPAYPIIERPTEPGWYWFRGAAKPSIWTMRRIFDGGDGDLWMDAPNDSEVPLREASSGQWRGPIPEPGP